MSNVLPVKREWNRAHRHAPLLVLAALLSACAGQPFAAPAPRVAVPAEWSEIEAPLASADTSAYWRQLDDPLLSELVEQAIVQNRDIAASAARLDQARAAVVQARSAYLPTLSGNGSATRDIGDAPRDGVPLSLGLDASWEADLFGQVSGNVAAARADLAAQGYGLADLQRLIVGQVALQTINARALASQLAIARDTLGNQRENLQIARWRNQAGLVSSLDVEQARTQVAQTAASIPSLEASLAATANAISTLIGEPPGRVLAAFDTSTTIPTPPALAGLAAPAALLERRPDLRSAEASLYAAGARIGVARAQMLPLVRLTGSIGTGPVTAGNLFDIVTGGLVGSLSQLLFDGGRTAAQVDSAEAGAEAALAQWEGAILSALEEVESAAVSRRTADERVTINEDGLDAANNSAILARSQYEAGLIDFRTLLSAESALLSARNQLASAEADRASAFVQLTQALGGGWSADAYDFPLSDSSQSPSDRTDQ